MCIGTFHSSETSCKPCKTQGLFVFLLKLYDSLIPNAISLTVTMLAVLSGNVLFQGCFVVVFIFCIFENISRWDSWGNRTPSHPNQ